MREVPVSLWLLCLAALCIHGALAQREPLATEAPEVHTRSYIILAPNTIHAGLPFTMSVSILEAASDVMVTATILKGRSMENVATATERFASGATSMMNIQVPEHLIMDTFKLQIEGNGGLTFSQIEDLHFSLSSFAILVQSDKAIYKPGQTVHFRAMAIYPNLLPYMGVFQVKMKDPVGNIIQQWSDLQNADHGVVSGETVMSDNPILGDWVISITANNEKKDHIITIDEYVLPKFEVNILVPPYFVEEDAFIIVRVEAKYTYGEPVKGRASLEMTPSWGQEPAILRYTAEIDEDAEIRITKKELLSLYEYGFYDGYLLKVNANVTESLTGIVQSGFGVLTYYEKPIKVTALPGNPAQFKPGLMYTAYVSVTHVDDSPLTAAERQRKLVVTSKHQVRDYSVPQVTDMINDVSIPENGILQLDFTFPADSSSASYQVMYYYGTDEGASNLQLLETLSPAVSPSNQFLQIIAQGTSFQSGSMASFEVRTTEAPSKLSYQVVSKGNIILSESVSNVASTTTTILTLELTHEMAPQARLIVSYIRDENFEVVLDSININVDGAFQNEVTVTFDQDEVKPGDNINLEVTAEANSYVGILAIDTSVMLLKTGNDITQNQVIEALGEFDTTDQSYNPFEGPVFRKKRSSMCCGWYPFPNQGDTTQAVLDSAGMLVFTDALVYSTPVIDYPWLGRGDAAAPGLPVEAKLKVGSALETSSAPIPAPTPPRVRSEFPETWLWSENVAGANGRVSVSSTVPDTITSWVASAFAMSTQTGIGVAESAAKVKVFQPFFVSLTLPYSVIRGEKLVIKATIFNYMSSSVQATVTLAGSVEFQSLSYNDNRSEKKSNEDQVKSVKVLAGEGVTLYFPILPQKLGLIDISITATSNVAGDAVVRQLLVEPEGIPTSFNEPVVIDFGSEQGTKTKDFIFGYPKNKLVEGSVRAQLTATGDIMGPTMAGLDKLLRLPSGCGEQTMLSFAPDVFIYSYLTSTSQDNPTIMKKALDYMNKGYQHELTYKHSDHSFSAFGDRDPSGSTWLTAFVIKSFVQAKPFIYIDFTMVRKSCGWLISQQTRDGNFLEPGKVIHTDMQGGVSSDYTITAYVLITLKEVQLKKEKASSSAEETLFWNSVSNSVSLATTYLEASFSTVSGNVYDLALVSYALTLAESEQVQRFQEAFEALAIVEDGVKHWAKPVEQVENVDAWSCFYYPPPSSDIEMTGYGLLMYLAQDKVAESSAVARWLTSQRNEYGGYGSTQDTVIGLQALSSFATIFNSNPRNIAIDITASATPDYSTSLTIDDDNSVVFQRVELPVTMGTVSASISGTGSCILQFSVFYNLMEVLVRPSFELTVEMVDKDKDTVTITACGKYIGSDDSTGMSMLEVGLPSGFYADEDALKNAVKEDNHLEKYEIAQRTVFLYLNALRKDTLYCFTVMAIRDTIVTNLKPSNAVIYDYYRPGDQTVASYSSRSLTEMSICDTCPVCCGDSGTGRITATSLLTVTMVAFLVILI
ncbi:CD109 antigen-like isoform X2 [Asterias rubens]|uniref:CD109 antigen-like isoform X2 n=1 Tax=Asterias rubens TaxID=7604 RepID=UPI001455C84B|nr:CD109 antigen-like isoform X2 [Asterias rubens]